MKIVIRNYFSNIEIGLDLDAESVRRIKRGKHIKEVIEFIDDEDITMTEVNELGDIVEKYAIDEFDATEAIQDAEDSCFCTIEYIK